MFQNKFRLNYATFIGDINFIRSFTSTTRSLADNENNPNENNPNENNSNESNSNESNSQNGYNSDNGSGYETDSNRSYYEDGTDAMVNHPARELPDDQLKRFIDDTAEIVEYPAVAGIDGDDDPSNAGMRQQWVDRNKELTDELDRRIQGGEIESSGNVNTSTQTYESANKKNTIDDNIDNSSSSTNKRKFEADSDSSAQPPKPEFKQDESSSINKRKFEAESDSSAQPPKPEFKQDESSSTNKRKFEADSDSSAQPPKPEFKQDSSDILPEYDLPSYGWDSED